MSQSNSIPSFPSVSQNVSVSLESKECELKHIVSTNEKDIESLEKYVQGLKKLLKQNATENASIINGLYKKVRKNDVICGDLFKHIDRCKFKLQYHEKRENQKRIDQSIHKRHASCSRDSSQKRVIDPSQYENEDSYYIQYHRK